MADNLAVDDVFSSFTDDRSQGDGSVISALCLSPFLKMGTTLASFHSSGIFP